MLCVSLGSAGLYLERLYIGSSRTSHQVAGGDTGRLEGSRSTVPDPDKTVAYETYNLEKVHPHGNSGSTGSFWGLASYITTMSWILMVWKGKPRGDACNILVPVMP